MAERQVHGFDYQNELDLLNENLILSTEYIGKWDGYENFNGIKYPASIKCIKEKASIDFGDIKRISKIDEDFILYVGFWLDKNTKKAVKHYKVLINKENWKKYLGDVSILDALFAEMKTISNDYSDDKKWTEFRKRYNKLYGKSIIALRFKRDHESQKRIQCGITYPNFIKIILKENTIL